MRSAPVSTLHMSGVTLLVGFLTAVLLGLLDPAPGWFPTPLVFDILGMFVLLGATALLILAGGSVVLPTNLAREAEAVVQAYSHLVAESGTRLPESALPYSKDVIRRSLLLWAALDTDAGARDRLCSMYMMLEDYLPHDDWLVLNEWDRLIKAKDVDGMMAFGDRAVHLMKETNARGAERMDEFKRKLAQLDEARRPAT